MRERVAAFGGRLQLASAPATGTWLRVALPVAGTPVDSHAGDATR